MNPASSDFVFMPVRRTMLSGLPPPPWNTTITGVG